MISLSLVASPETPSQAYAESSLRRQGELLPLQHFRDVKIEKVAVKDGLDTASEDRDQVEESLEVVSVCPVEDVQSPVGSESEEVVGSDRFGLSGLADHEQLGQDRDAFQVDREGPQDLHWIERVVDDQGNECRRDQQEFYSECVMIAVIGCLEFDKHEIDGSKGSGDEKDLHGGVVQRDEVGQQIQISRREDNRKQDLRLAGDSSARPSLPYFPQEKREGQKMR